MLALVDLFVAALSRLSPTIRRRSNKPLPHQNDATSPAAVHSLRGRIEEAEPEGNEHVRASAARWSAATPAGQAREVQYLPATSPRDTTELRTATTTVASKAMATMPVKLV
ncbi:hypothetical protein ABZP36_002323 [Zizania latifolia]